MYISKENSELFAKARQENRQIFREHWNGFIATPAVLAALITYTVLQGLVFVCSGGFVHRQAELIGLLGILPPTQEKLIILGVQIVLNLPGILFCVGFWCLRKKTRWEGDSTPNMIGVRLLRVTNWGLTGVTGLMLGLYPTVIIYSGDFLKQEELTRVFYIFLCSTALLAISATMLRLVLRNLEENISCCWAKTNWLLPLILVLGASIAAGFLFMKECFLFLVAAALWAGALLWILCLYYRFLSRVSKLQEAVDQKAIQTRGHMDDPYSRY